MKNIYLVLFLVFLLSCENSTDNNETKEDSIDMNGPDIEVNVLEFDIEKSTTEIEIVNRLDEDINKISGLIAFFDEAGQELTHVTGKSKASPFSRSENPQIVKSKSKRKLTLKNKIITETHSIQILDFKATTISGKEVKID